MTMGPCNAQESEGSSIGSIVQEQSDSKLWKAKSVWTFFVIQSLAFMTALISAENLCSNYLQESDQGYDWWMVWKKEQKWFIEASNRSLANSMLLQNSFGYELKSLYRNRILLDGALSFQRHHSLSWKKYMYQAEVRSQKLSEHWEVMKVTKAAKHPTKMLCKGLLWNFTNQKFGPEIYNPGLSQFMPGTQMLLSIPPPASYFQNMNSIPEQPWNTLLVWCNQFKSFLSI